jgi:hypothetical protein
MIQRESALKAAEKSGALVRYKVDLDQGEFEERRLWLRPEIDAVLRSQQLDPRQVQVVRAALRRFVLGANFTVVTADCEYREVEPIGDIRELRGYRPPFIELRFKPPKHDFRVLRRFVGKDSLVLTTYGMKSLTGKTGQKALIVSVERNRCEVAFRAAGLQINWVPPEIKSSVSKARFI